ncbi:type I-F CRISPR-associated helicase Cas3f [Rhodocyclus gracilis]|uniref:Type I-F CRISPR-associated helicase Cas3 n=1 Tax=Rhodocyclus tenuis TaxID=1066 RepID=A0A6L5JVM3_RHOTE|nr:type I-F CRISPR-associated helicase Cas3f [Rhodocyclus gracilis]MQY51289.1 type I-F CRISPR-associated helicase Cas3 [Rhodocyclus gracilis]
MNVLLISQCDKRALTETRRILDQFAERRGDRTWQTPITNDGLQTLHRLLRRSARKNTAVACHWIRGLDHSELLWVVGDRSRFNAQGAVPTNATQHDVLRQHDENDWHTGELIRLLADLAGLLHDLGKAIAAFQLRLAGKIAGHNLIRHEWVSLRLFATFVGDDDDAAWLARLGTLPEHGDESWKGRLLYRDGLDAVAGAASPFKSLHQAPLAQALGWLVLTHHRLPEWPGKEAPAASQLRDVLTLLDPSWNERDFRGADPAALAPYWKFPQGLSVSTEAWRQRAARLARHLLAMVERGAVAPPLANPYVMHLSRLCLMLADHHYSALEDEGKRVVVTPGNTLYANTLRTDGRSKQSQDTHAVRYNQPLDEHLVGVAKLSAEIARFLPRFGERLPRLGRRRRLRQRVKDERFRWQDKAAEVAGGMRDRAKEHGAFIINMASTGCGKTLANARVMDALADPEQGMRCAFALGLRTLTLQTGHAFRDLLGLSDDDLAIRVGGSASRALFEHFESQAEASGSASSQSLLDEDGEVCFEGDSRVEDHPFLRRAIADQQVRSLLLAPLLVCTIDHLTPATESQRGGRQIAPMLRLMSSDLVLDEPDDFDISDLPALTRLVHWAGLLGARVLLSSATLPPALVQGLFEAYRNGRQHFQRNRGSRPGSAEAPPAICCAWIDEFHQQQADCAEASTFQQNHQRFAERRHAELAKLAADPRRRGALLPLPSLPRDAKEMAQAFASEILSAALALHKRHHSIDPLGGKRVSFGLVRMANIEPMIDVALALYKAGVPAGTRVHLCVYHARHPLLIRSAIERQLDRVLQRHDPEAVFRDADIRTRLDTTGEANQIFVVLGSPVTEVGRDHDYDWAVVEPSSMRSLIQLAGRVRRHRPGKVEHPNILVFRSNLRNFRQPNDASFKWPGFEQDTGQFRLHSHDLAQLLRVQEWEVIDARPRIVAPAPEALQPRQSLVDLEHSRMRATMLGQPSWPVDGGRRSRRSAQAVQSPLSAATWWNSKPEDALTTALLQQMQPFRSDIGVHQVDLALLPNEDGDDFLLHRINSTKDAHRAESVYVRVDRSLHVRIADEAVRGSGIEPWGITDYLATLAQLATELDLPLDKCAKRFGVVTVPENETGWLYHPTLGFSINK